MANVRSGNSHYVDATGVLESEACSITGVVLTATSANAVLELADSAGTTKKLNLRVATSGESRHFNFSEASIYFPNGIKVATLTNAIATVLYK